MQLSRFENIFSRPVWPSDYAEPDRLGIAVSGGGDSVALLRALAEWGQGRDTKLFAITIDHGLRAEAAQEAEWVAKLCADLEIPHETRGWHWDGQGNTQDAARQARKTLIGDWARKNNIATVALGHTLDDQAETLLMRLARGSGVDGLAAMSQVSESAGICWVRPILTMSRAALRRYLKALPQDWCEDPSNENPAYARVATRQAIATLSLDQERLAETATRMQMASAALGRLAYDTAREMTELTGGAVWFDRMALVDMPAETRYRLLAHALGWVSSTAYRPRFAAIKQAWAAVKAQKTHSLHGCLILSVGHQVVICRELQAVVGVSVDAPGCWDRRWVCDAAGMRGLKIAALGEAGLAQCPGWREENLPRPLLLAAPALWQMETVCHAPLAGLGDKTSIYLKNPAEEFFLSLLSH